jgi:hypothetical protein
MGRPFKTHCIRGHDLSVTRRKGSRSYYCGECTRVPRDFPSWRTSAKRDYGLRRLYGIGQEQWEVILASQGGGCAICGTTEWGKKGPQTDHCHTTGRVRGVLCQPCNTTLGQSREDPARLRAAAAYLETFQGPPA